jgi:hypothetical protein
MLETPHVVRFALIMPTVRQVVRRRIEPCTRRAPAAFLRVSLSYAVSVGSARLTAPAAGV